MLINECYKLQSIQVHQLLLVFILNEDITILSTKDGFEINKEKKLIGDEAVDQPGRGGGHTTIRAKRQHI